MVADLRRVWAHDASKVLLAVLFAPPRPHIGAICRLELAHVSRGTTILLIRVFLLLEAVTDILDKVLVFGRSTNLLIALATFGRALAQSVVVAGIDAARLQLEALLVPILGVPPALRQSTRGLLEHGVVFFCHCGLLLRFH